MSRRRDVEVFSLSFLDCICCGFGAIILLLVLTEVNQPVQLEKSRQGINGQVRRIEEQLAVIRGQTDELNRELLGSRETLDSERRKLAQLAGDLSTVRGQYSASMEDAAVTNHEAAELVATQQKLTRQMRQLLKEQAWRTAARAAGGIPLDSQYLIFVIDTSDSMTTNHWPENLTIIRELLSLYPHLVGLQVMNDQGTYLYPATRGTWLKDSPRLRADIEKRVRDWRPFSESNPVPGMEEALRTYWSADKHIAVIVLGDEFTGSSYQTALVSIEKLNRPGRDGRPMVRIHAIGFPEGPDMPDETNIRFAALMRLICEESGGTFVGMLR